ncbi:uncharacterized protein CC84DRAFT_363121 [Paraphaeosphaeria sporulosa]|uniref:Uncharacterized protein n=1 Tax=Paraphaeosphaeria sporulosa TaxID=1460663 RepID=A0A177BZP7_9PLEO|nr:uncharacterized protein CC84DRAFT_363121 [Paraphaeosphaeria sporulosa]OAG00189.1 hypothetical protein CC84DRAFT_363121 [Paraphaeosphaeria sporulosa]
MSLVVQPHDTAEKQPPRLTETRYTNATGAAAAPRCTRATIVGCPTSPTCNKQDTHVPATLPHVAEALAKCEMHCTRISHNQDENNVACREGQPHPFSWIFHVWKSPRKFSRSHRMVPGKACDKHYPSPAAAAPFPWATGKAPHRTSKEIGGVLIGRCSNFNKVLRAYLLKATPEPYGDR